MTFFEKYLNCSHLLNCDRYNSVCCQKDRTTNRIRHFLENKANGAEVYNPASISIDVARDILPCDLMVDRSYFYHVFNIFNRLVGLSYLDLDLRSFLKMC